MSTVVVPVFNVFDAETGLAFSLLYTSVTMPERQTTKHRGARTMTNSTFTAANNNIFNKLWNDEAGFIVSAELVDQSDLYV